MSGVVGSLDHALAGIARLRRREEKENSTPQLEQPHQHLQNHHEKGGTAAMVRSPQCYPEDETSSSSQQQRDNLMAKMVQLRCEALSAHTTRDFSPFH